MKKIYSLLAAGALFAAGATAQEGPTIGGSHDLMLLPVFGQLGMEKGPGSLFEVEISPENTIVESGTDFYLWVALKNAPSTDNEVSGTPYFTFISNSFHPGPGSMGFGYGQTIPFDMDAAIPLNEAETEHAMLLKSYPNATVYSEGTPEEQRDDGHIADYTLSADSLYRLIDLDDYENPNVDTLTYITKENFVHGETYGLFYRISAHGTVTDGAITTIYEDVDPSNNMVVMPLTWNTDPISVGEMIKEGATQKIVIFPNPVQDQFSFDHIYGQKTNSVQINIVDITGKVVYTQSEAAPTQVAARYNVNTNGLAAGTYMVQLVTDNYTATSKFVKL